MIPGKLNNETFQEARRKWFEYLHSCGQSIKVQPYNSPQMETFLKEVAQHGDAAVFADAVQYTIANGWINLRWRRSDNGKPGTNGHQPTEAETAWETTLAAIRKHSSYKPDAVKAEIGPTLTACAKDAGGISAIDEGTEYDRKSQREKFIAAYARRNGVAT